MVEIPTPEWMKEGHLFDRDRVRFDLYILLLIFLGDKSIYELDNVGLSGLAGEFQDNEVTRLLISTAVSIRVNDDNVQQRHREKSADYKIWYEKQNFVCGKLFEEEKEFTLSLREGCNKIIHAKKVQYDLEEKNPWGRKDETAPGYLRPIVHLYGEKDKKSWKADLDIVLYVENGNRFLRSGN